MIFRFGDFELDEDRFELRRQGRPVSAQPKVLRLLLLLVAERHRSLSDAELMQTLWPSETVSPASIKRAVMGARIALDDRTQRCIRTVRGHGYQFVLPVSESAGGSKPAPAPSSRPSATLSASFVGREGVLAELQGSLSQTWAGQGHCVLIFGEPGMGKTRVLQELAERAGSSGARVWFGRCMEFDGAPPFWPLQQVLREALKERSIEQLHTLLGPGASDIVEGFPELRGDLHAEPGSAAAGAARFRFFESTTRFLIRAAEDKPIALLLDDLQCADQPTLRLLSFLIKQLSGSRLLLVGTARGQDERERAARPLLTALAQDSGTRSIRLSGLSRAEVARYVELRTGLSAPAAVADRLCEQTAGNPLFVEELLRGLRAREDFARASPEPCWEHLAEAGRSVGIRGAIDRHLATSSTACRELLSNAAVIGREFSVGLLRPLLEEDAERALALLSEAIAAGIVQHSPERVGHYRFTHALLRDALYEGTAPLERARRHARVGLVLEARGAAVGDDAELAQLAEHFRLAAPSHDAGKALHYARCAAKRALRRLAHEEAALHLARALALLDLQEPDPALRMQLLLERGEALTLGADPASGRACLLQAVALARTLKSRDVLAEAARLLGLGHESGTLDPEQIEVLREALGLFPADDPRAPRLGAMLAKALSYSSEHAERTPLALSALAASAKLCDPTQRAEALYACHEALTHPNELPQRRFIADELKRLAHETGDARTMLHALSAQFQNGVERGDMASMASIVQALAALAHKERDPVVRWYEKSYRCTLAMIGGRLREAEASAEEALCLGKLVGDEVAYHYYCAQRSGVLRLQDRRREAEELVHAMCARFPILTGWRSVAACLQADAGQRGVARETLRELIADDLGAVARDPYLLSALCPLAELCVRVGEPPALSLLYEALLPHEAHHGNVSFGAASYGPISMHLAQLAGRLGALDASERHARRALHEAERMPSPTFTALSLLTLAQTRRRQEAEAARRESRDLTERARALAEQTEMHAVVRQCQALARALGAA